MSESFVWGFEPPSALRGLVGEVWFPANPPIAFMGDKTVPDAGWLEYILSDRWNGILAEWESGWDGVVVWPTSKSISLAIPGLSYVAALEVAVKHRVALTVFGPLVDWSDAQDQLPRLYRVDGNLPSTRSSMLFIGQDGHRRLVSRRWLEHGPWARCLVSEGDVSLVLFHDPAENDPTTALGKAYPGHARMGVGPEGGYLHLNHDYGEPIEGTYLPDQRRFIVVVHGREVPQREMLDAAAMRRDSKTTDRPIERFSYVFIEKSVAEAHLHELWLRELECWAIVDGVEVRLDEHHQPKRVVPEWAAAVEAHWQPVLEALCESKTP